MLINKKYKSSIIIIFSVIITLIVSIVGITVNAEYDAYGNYYEPSASELTSVSSSESSIILEDDAVLSSDTSELNSDDWKKVQENLNSTFGSSVASSTKSDTDNNGDFKNIKDNPGNSASTNDTWIFLFIGLVLITLGVAAIVFVIAATVHTKHNTNSAMPKYSQKKNNSDNKKP